MIPMDREAVPIDLHDFIKQHVFIQILILLLPQCQF